MSKRVLKKWKIGTIIGLFFVLCVTAVCGSSLQSFAAKENSPNEKEKKQFEIEATIGINGSGKLQKDMIADVTVTNNGEDFEGNVEIIMPVRIDADAGENTAYQEPFSIKAGETKTVSVSIYLHMYSPEMRIHITNKDNDIVQKESERIYLYTADEEIIGVLTDQEDEFEYLALYSTNANNYIVDYFSEENFPSLKEGFECIDYLLVDDYDTTKWSKEQYQAVTEWVKDGGILILGTGASGEKTLAGFEKDFLDVNIKGVDKDGVAQLNVTDGEVTNALQNDLTLTKVKRDSGWIYVIPEDLVLDYEVWRTKGIDYAELLHENLRRDKFGYLVDQVTASEYDGRGLNVLDKEKIPGILCYGIVLGIYAVVISIGLFFVLKKKGKLEWRWKLVPVIMIVCSVIIYGIGSKSRMTTPEMIYSRTLEYAGEGETSATAQMDFSVTSPYSENYSMAVPKEENVFSRENDVGCSEKDWNEDVDKEKQEAYMESYKMAIREEGEQQIVTFSDFASFESAYLGTRERKVETGGTYHSDITCDKYEYSGTFTNETGYDIKHAIFLAEGRVYKLGEIKAGETVTISDDLKNGFSSCQMTYIKYGWNEEGGLCDYCDISRCFSVNTPNEEQQYASVLKNYFYNENYTGRILEPKVIGDLSCDQMDESTCAEWGMKCSGTTFGVFPIDVKEKDGETFVGDVLAKSYGLGSVSSSYRSIENYDAVYEYRMQDNETLTGLYYLPIANDEKQEILSENYQAAIAFAGEVQAYNYDKKKYETIFKNTEKREIKNVKSYTGKDNMLRLKFKVSEDMDSYSAEMRVPVISATKKVE